MPLRQSVLGFERKFSQTQSDTMISEISPQPRLQQQPSRSSSTSSATLAGTQDPDTIVLEDFPRQPQLPTPVDSTIDASSDGGHDAPVEQCSRRETRLLTRKASKNGLLQTTASEKQRSVSGDTLVTNTSQSSILQSGIAALDLSWSVTSLMKEGSPNCSKGPANTDRNTSSADEEEQLRLTRAAERKTRMVENAKQWEAKKKVAEEKAVRRSSRASLLVKASDTVSDLKDGLLGKRSRDTLEKGKDRLGDLKRRASLRPRSMVEPLGSSTPSFEGPTTKKRRFSDGLPRETSQLMDHGVSPKKPIFVRKEKKWLRSGLYTGQTRDFDGRLSESKNRRKHASAVPADENKTLPLPMFAGERILKNGRDFRLPFDVFSPLPSGQPKPDEWRRTNKNVFVGDAAQVWRHSKPREHSTCMCGPGTGCDDNCINRFMFYECDGRNCNLSECSNRSFQALGQRTKKGGKYNIGVEVIQTSDRGFGVRSNRTFEPNQIIVEYTGEIITQDECDERMRTIYKNNECYYLMSFDQNMIIDATRGSIARFVNHSCEPNCRMEKWTVGGKPRMALFAGDKGIMTGDELTYDYNFDPFSQKNVQACRCGSKKCRGVLGPKSKEEKKPKVETVPHQQAAKESTGAKRKIAELLEEGGDRWKKRPKMAVPTSALAALKHVTAKPQASAKARTSSVVEMAPGQAVGKATSVKKQVSKTASPARRRSVAGRRSVSGRSVRPGNATRLVSNSSSAPLIQGKKTESRLSRKDSVKSTAAAGIRKVVRSVRAKG